MQIQAHAKHLRMSPKKVRLVIDLIRGMNVTNAEHQLRFMNKAAAKPVLKLLRSAIANAENNFQLNKSDLYVKEIRADEGVSLRRSTPKAFGRSATIHRQASHIHITIDVKSGAKTDEKVAVSAEEKKSLKTAAPDSASEPKTSVKKTVAKKTISEKKK